MAADPSIVPDSSPQANSRPDTVTLRADLVLENRPHLVEGQALAADVLSHQQVPKNAPPQRTVHHFGPKQPA